MIRQNRDTFYSGPDPFVLPDYDDASFTATREALLTLAEIEPV